MSDAPKDNLEELASLVLTEMLTRVKDNPGDVSTPVLSRLATDLNRFIERRVRDEEEEEHKPFSLYDTLASVPKDRGVALAREEIERLESETVRLKTWIDAVARPESRDDAATADRSVLPTVQVGSPEVGPAGVQLGHKQGGRAA